MRIVILVQRGEEGVYVVERSHGSDAQFVPDLVDDVVGDQVVGGREGFDPVLFQVWGCLNRADFRFHPVAFGQVDGVVEHYGLALYGALELHVVSSVWCWSDSTLSAVRWWGLSLFTPNVHMPWTRVSGAVLGRERNGKFSTPSLGP